MLDGVLRSALAVIGLTPEQANAMVHEAFKRLVNIDRRIARIEEKLGIEKEESENGGE